MNEARHGKHYLKGKNAMRKKWESGMRPSWTYKLGQNIISIEKEEKDLRMVIHNNLSSEKHIDKTFGNTLRMLRNIRMGFSLSR